MYWMKIAQYVRIVPILYHSMYNMYALYHLLYNVKRRSNIVKQAFCINNCCRAFYYCAALLQCSFFGVVRTRRFFQNPTQKKDVKNVNSCLFVFATLNMRK